MNTASGEAVSEGIIARAAVDGLHSSLHVGDALQFHACTAVACPVFPVMPRCSCAADGYRSEGLWQLFMLQQGGCRLAECSSMIRYLSVFPL